MKNYCPFFGGFAKVYVLSDENGNVFYVGCCLRDLSQRLKSHLVEAKGTNSTATNHKKNAIIRSLDYHVLITEIDRMWVTSIKPSWALIKSRDLEYAWINHYRSMGYEMCNRVPKPGTKRKPIKLDVVRQHYANLMIA